MKNIFQLIWIFTTPLLISSCKNYYIPKESFAEQLAGIDSTRLQEVTVAGPYGESYNYLANPLSKIKCVDKKGESAELTNGPSIEIRITVNNHKKIIFYFDRVMIQDSIVYGVRSRFMNLRSAVPLKDITKIEVQDGHKNFHYKKAIK
jgi:hypothetical protein